jgi:phospholipase C
LLNDGKTKTPIKHVLVIIGENRSFDHVFATYKPKGGQRIDNILSKGIINEDGTPGPNFSLAIQKSAVDSPPSTYELSPGSQTPYAVLPPVLAGGPKTPYVSSLAAGETAESARSRPTTCRSSSRAPRGSRAGRPTRASRRTR